MVDGSGSDAAEAQSHRSVCIYLLASLVSSTGDRVSPIAIAFGLLALTRSSVSAVAIVLGVSAAAMVVTSIPAGVIADRYSRKLIVVVSIVIRAMAQVATGWILLTEPVNLVGVVLFQAVYGAAGALYGPAAAAMLPLIATDAQRTNSKASLLDGVTRVGAPAVGGLLVAIFHPAWILFFDAITFFVAAALISTIRVSRTQQDRHSFSSEVAAGLKAVRSTGWLTSYCVVMTLWPALTLAPTLLLGIVLSERRYGGSGAWGTIVAFYGFGLVLGSLFLLGANIRRRLLVAATAASMFSVIPLTLSLALPLWTVCACAVLGGIGQSIGDILFRSSIQDTVADAHMARVFSVVGLGSSAAIPVGYVGAGLVVGGFGVGPEIVLALATLGGLSPLALISMKRVRHLSQNI